MIEAFIGKNITEIACGSSHSAAIADNKELYTWGLGSFGRLGHGDENSQHKPKLVSDLCRNSYSNILLYVPSLQHFAANVT